MPLANGRYTGALYRALNPVFAREPLSGRGAERHGGRFNAKGTPTLYTAIDPATALREANQVGSLQPTVLVSYRADLGPIFDTRDRLELEKRGMSARALADPGWRMTMLEGKPPPDAGLRPNTPCRRIRRPPCAQFRQGNVRDQPEHRSVALDWQSLLT